jgi:hypothetical protein
MYCCRIYIIVPKGIKFSNSINPISRCPIVAPSTAVYFDELLLTPADRVWIGGGPFQHRGVEALGRQAWLSIATVWTWTCPVFTDSQRLSTSGVFSTKLTIVDSS